MSPQRLHSPQHAAMMMPFNSDSSIHMSLDYHQLKAMMEVQRKQNPSWIIKAHRCSTEQSQVIFLTTATGKRIIPGWIFHPSISFTATLCLGLKSEQR